MLSEAEPIPEERIQSVLRAAVLSASEELGLLPPAEQKELQDWLERDPLHKVWLQQHTDTDGRKLLLAGYEKALQMSAEALETFHRTHPEISEAPAIRAVHRIHLLKTAWLRYAALLILIAGTALYLYRITTPPKDTVIIRERTAEVKPGGGKAILTLADGKRIVLDSAANGSLAQQGGTRIIKLNDGSLAYRTAGAAPVESLYNTIRTPNGGQYQIVLPDGSKVWLNAASGIKFPVAFTGQQRRVEVTGETYMEIAPNNKQPFFVTANGVEIQVLGTRFNVNAYSDEQAVRATLVEGSVKIVKGISSQILQPGQQAVITRTIQLNRHADTEQVIAWKSGRFNFDNAILEEVMRQLARWYDIDVVYPKGIPTIRFDGELSRHMPLESVLQALGKSEVHYRLEGRRLTILP